MFKSPSKLSEAARNTLANTLNARLADGLDLYSQVKVAHWNIRGPLFAALHPLFDTVAQSANEYNDGIAERAATLGGRVFGTARHVASTSRLPEYPQQTTRDLEHARAVCERVEAYLEGLRESRHVAEELADADTVDLITNAIRDFEKHGWMLRATLEG